MPHADGCDGRTSAGSVSKRVRDGEYVGPRSERDRQSAMWRASPATGARPHAGRSCARPSTRQHAPHLVRIHCQRRGDRLASCPRSCRRRIACASSRRRSCSARCCLCSARCCPCSARCCPCSARCCPCSARCCPCSARCARSRSCSARCRSCVSRRSRCSTCRASSIESRNSRSSPSMVRLTSASAIASRNCRSTNPHSAG